MPELNQAYYDAIPELDSSYDNGNAPVINSEQMSMGCFERNYHALPSGCMAAAPSFPDSLLMDPAEAKERIAENVAKKRTLLDLREFYYPILKSLNQDGLGLCWYFSSTKSILYTRALEGQEQTPLSPWWGAGLINSWRDRGGWSLASLGHIAIHGIPKLSLCPEYKSQYATPETAADAATRKVTEWYDGGDDPERNWHIQYTCAALNIPTASDFNHMSHAMCVPFVKPDLSGSIPDNSWGENSGEKGLYRLEGRRAYPNSIVVPCVGAFAK